MLFDKAWYIPERVIVASSHFPSMVIVWLNQLLAQVVWQKFGIELILATKIYKKR